MLKDPVGIESTAAVKACVCTVYCSLNRYLTVLNHPFSVGAHNITNEEITKSNTQL